MDLGIGGLGEATQIGAGGAAIVYRARQDNLGRDVAVKVLSNVDENFVRRFQREAKTLGKLSQNPGIVTVYDTGKTSSGQPYLVLELCKSSLLDRVKETGKIDPLEACSILADVAEAVADAHDLGVVHRDIKPANMLLSPGGRYLITDFGIASVSGTTAGETSTVGFTAAYAAPETFQEDETGPSTDVYSIGATLFHLVAGHPPFVTAGEERNLLAVLHRVVTEPVPDLRQQGVPSPVCEIIESAMAKEAKNRPTIRELAELLGQASFDQILAGLIANDDPNPDGATDDTINDPASTNDAPPNGAITSAATNSSLFPGSSPKNPASGKPADESVEGSAATVHTLKSDASDKDADATVVQAKISETANQTDAQTTISIPSTSDDSQGPSLPPPVGAPSNQNAPAVEAPSTNVLAPRSAGQPGLTRGPTVNDDGLLLHREQPYLSTSFEDKPERGLWALGAVAAFLIVAAVGSVIFFMSRDSTELAADTETVQTDQDSEVTTPPGESERVTSSSSPGQRGDLTASADDEQEAIAVPLLEGKSERAAIAALEDVGAEYVVTYRSSNFVKRGNVIRTSPGPSQSVDPDTQIIVYVSTGEKTTAIDDVVGMTATAAKQTLTEAEFDVETVSKPSSTVAAGYVISMDPEAGELAGRGSTITITVSTGPPCSGLVLPAFAGNSYTAASATIAEAGLTETAVEQISADVAAGHVVSSTPTTGDCVEEGGSVSLVVSCAAKEIPSTEGLTAADLAVLTTAGFSTTIEEVENAGLPAGSIVSTAPTAGTPACVGTDVVVVVTKVPCLGTVPPHANGLYTRYATLLTRLEVTPVVTEAPSSQIAAGRVITTTPGAGTVVCPGDSLAVTVSTGPVCELIPPLAGLTQQAAETTLSGLGFQVTTTRAFNNTRPRNTVVSSAPAVGVKHCQPTAVALVISKGAPITMPSAIGAAEATAVSALTTLGLVPVVQYASVAAGSPQDGLVTGQSLAPATRQEIGTSVTLTVAQAAVAPPVPGP